MLELFETRPDVNVQESEYQRLLGLPKNHLMQGRTRELADAARRWYAEKGRPWFYAREINAPELADGKLRVGGMEFSSRQLHDQFAEAQAGGAVLVAVSAGRECEEHARQLWRESKPDEYFFMEIFGSAVVEHLVTVASGRICGWADQHGAAALPHYSPGYSGWDISDQSKLWDLLRQNGAAHFDRQLEVLETGMLRPKKSLLAVIGITRHPDKARRLARLVPCESCSLPNCQYRRAPHRRPPQQIEDVRALLSHALGELNNRNNATVLQSGAKYTTNPRALAKWVGERLHLEFLDDGAVTARFRYEGTTCSNMGRALEYDYHVKLAPREGCYRILEMHCVPAPGDTGHRFQCEYLNNAEALTRAIAGEKPLLGRPLNEVLNWQREYNPSGCFCDLPRREHKWGLVLEAIHFALARRETELAHGQAEMILE
ncbi:MAG TPA: hypothetical protein VMA35_02370 [Candidatus Sulfopaludibacter sp.]|nr:hypothetical protein [Candidatus Sulfopaludibacter sp.]